MSETSFDYNLYDSDLWDVYDDDLSSCYISEDYKE